MGSSHRQGFVAHEMQADDLRQRARLGIAKMATHRIAHHFPQFLDGFALRRDGVTQGGSDKAAVDLVLPNFKDDLAHAWNVAYDTRAGKADLGQIWASLSIRGFLVGWSEDAGGGFDGDFLVGRIGLSGGGADLIACFYLSSRSAFACLNVSLRMIAVEASFSDETSFHLPFLANPPIASVQPQ